MKLRRLSLVVLFSSTISNVPMLSAELPPVAGNGFRVAAANITSGRRPTYDEGHGKRILQATKPDVILIQEFNYGNDSEEDLREFIDDCCGEDYQYFREEDSAYDIPNGIISRFPIVDSGSIDDPVLGNRGFAWAEIKLPSKESLFVFSVHFHTKNESNRQRQAAAIVDYIKNNIDNYEDQLIIVGGDFNTAKKDEGALSTLKKITGDISWPKGLDGSTGTNSSRKKPYDHILESPQLDERLLPITLSGNEVFEEGIIFDTRDIEDEELLSPALRNDSGAMNMQHQIVIKDYSLN